MNTTDQDTVLRAMVDARRILAEHSAPGPHDATRTVHQLIAVSQTFATSGCAPRYNKLCALRYGIVRDHHLTMACP